MSVIYFQRPTYTAKAFTAPIGSAAFNLSGTLDGFIDLAIPNGPTFALTLDEARLLAVALQGAITDVKANCLYERDALLDLRPDYCG